MAPLSAHADEKTSAQASFELGKQLMVEGRFAEACPKLEESMRLQAGLGTMLFLAACYEKLGRTASAWAQFREAESLGTRLNDQRAQVARDKANALEPKLAKLTLIVPPSLRSLPKLEVRRDGVLLGAGLYDAAIAVDPGARKIDVIAAGKKNWSKEVNVAAEDAKASLRLPETLEDAPLVIGAGADVTRPSDQAANDGDTQRIVGLVVGGVGVVALGVGGVFGLQAKSKNDDSNADGHCRGNDCDRVGTNLRNDARDAATISTIGVIGGLALIGGGVAVFLTAPRAKAKATTGASWLSPVIGPTFGGVRGSFAF